MTATLRPLFEEPPTSVGSLRLGLAGNGDFRWAFADLTGPVEDVRRRLDLSPISAIALGRTLLTATLLLRFSTKYPGEMTVEVLGDGPLGKITARVDSEGYLRGTIGEPRFPGFDDGEFGIGRAVGKGLLRVTQQTVKRPEPWSSQVALADGTIGNDLVHFLHQSQQVNSAALLGLKPTPEGISAAGGFLVEALPGAAEQRIGELEERIQAISGIADLVAAGEESLLRAVLGDGEIEEMERHEIRYNCKCSKASLLQRLTGMPDDQLREIADEDGFCRLRCGFCEGEFKFDLDELRVH